MKRAVANPPQWQGRVEGGTWSPSGSQNGRAPETLDQISWMGIELEGEGRWVGGGSSGIFCLHPALPIFGANRNKRLPGGPPLPGGRALPFPYQSPSRWYVLRAFFTRP